MTEKIRQTLRDSKGARWLALGLVAFAMFTGYLFTEILSPLKPAVEKGLGWDSSDFGFVTSAYGWFNVFLIMLVIVGILLDKFGIRISAVSSALIMIIGASIKYYAFAADFPEDAMILGISKQVFVAAFGYALFGVGVEYAGITATKAIVKWFKGKEMALAMGLQVAFARLGSFAALLIAPFISEAFNVSTPFLIGVIFLIAGLLSYIVYNVMDLKLDREMGALKSGDDGEDDFKISDLSVILKNRGFWYIAFLCVLFYSAVFPFYKFGPDLMANKFGVPDKWIGLIPSLVPLGTIILTPVFGNMYDKKGKGASIMILGALLLVFVHIVLWLPFMTNVYVAAFDVIILGVAFSLVPSAMWPSVPKIIPEKQIGSAFALIFWIQNWGLMGVPFILGLVLEKTNPATTNALRNFREQFKAEGLNNEQIAEKITELKANGTIVAYDYNETWLIFIGLTLLAVVVAFLLKREDKRKGYGLQLPNIKNEEA